ncbi:outer membrane beta-barrel protein [uncultured Flavobacterium sp.]|uniref:outer membrane beta-barrel protein n=1 Tax=uncultured Flavobacterium sp. TaxID=165435 RepID=UPI00292FC1BE|nr:outer membrane beta-barrel protein [uncultured Flavobacterium sp.]
MKLKITAILAFFAFSFANAQQQQTEQEVNSAKGITFQHGDMFIEGGISVSTVKDASNTYSINPKFGYLVSDKVAIGADLSIYGSTFNKNTLAERKTNGYGIGAFARYYFLELDSRRFKAYGEVGLGYNHTKSEIAKVDDTANGIKANVTVGLNYFFTKKWAATFALADILTYNNTNPQDGTSTATFDLNINLFNNIFTQPKFGLLYKF